MWLNLLLNLKSITVIAAVIYTISKLRITWYHSCLVGCINSLWLLFFPWLLENGRPLGFHFVHCLWIHPTDCVGDFLLCLFLVLVGNRWPKSPIHNQSLITYYVDQEERFLLWPVWFPPLLVFLEFCHLHWSWCSRVRAQRLCTSKGFVLAPREPRTMFTFM